MISGWRTGFVVWLAMLSSCAGNQEVMPGIVGHWQGSGKIIVTWCQQTNLPLALEIKGDGTVTGKVGDATLTKGRFRRNRGWLGRRLHIKTDYIITGSLEGPIVATEGIVRSGVKMPVNYSAGKLVGGMHTTGSKFGGKKSMILSASLNLTKTAASTVESASRLKGSYRQITESSGQVQWKDNMNRKF